MTDVSRTITIKFTGNTKGLVTAVAEADAALKAVGKSSPELEKLSKALENVGTSTETVTKKTSKLTVLRDAFRSLADGIQPLGTAGLRISAITAAVVSLASAAKYVAPLIGLIGLLPGVVGIAAGAFAVLKLGSDGIAAAFKGVGDAAKKQVSDVFQKELVPGAKAAKAILDKLTPSLKDVASELSSVGDAFIEEANKANNIKSLNTILAATKKVVGDIGGALGPLLTAFLTIASIAAPIFAKLTDGAIVWAVKLQQKVQEIAQNGKLATWIQNGITRFTQLKDGVVRAWKDIEPILKALAGSRLTLFAGIGSTVIEPALKAIGNFISAHPDFAQWVIAAGLALKALAVAFGILNAALDVNPIFLAIEAVALLAVGLYALYQNNAGFKQWVDAVFQGIKDIVGAFVGWWQQNVAPVLAKAWELVQAAAEGVYEFFRDHLVPRLKELWAGIEPILGQIWQNLVDAWNGIKPTFDQIIKWIKDHWSEIKEAAKDFGIAVGIVVGLVIVAIVGLGLAIAAFALNISQQIKWAVDAFNGFKDAATNVSQWIGQKLLDLGGQVNAVANDIKIELSGPWNQIKNAANDALSWIQQQWSSAGSWFTGIGKQIAAGLVGGFQSVVGAIRGIINAAIDLANGGIDKVNGGFGIIGVPAIPHIPHLALGGPVVAGRPYIVGDGGGPELFVPRQNGTVVGTKDTADLMGGGGWQGDVVIHADFGSGIEQVFTIKNRQLRAAVKAGAR